MNTELDALIDNYEMSEEEQRIEMLFEKADDFLINK
jgi:hypothetical protein